MELKQFIASRKALQNRFENDYLESLSSKVLVVNSEEPLVPEEYECTSAPFYLCEEGRSIELFEHSFMTCAQSYDHEEVLCCFSNLV